MSQTVLVRGLGSIGARHARVAGSLEDTRVEAWPVRSVPRTLDDGVELLDDRSGPARLAAADLVVIATDTGRHVADTLQALDAGARCVLLEKPVAPTLEAARALAEHPGRDRVWVAAPLRASAAFRHLGSLVPSLGQHLSAHVWSQSWLPDWRPDRDYRSSYSADAEQGGVLRDLVHELDYVAVLFGSPTLVGATLDHSGPLEIAAEQSATLLLQTASAPAVTVRLDYITRPTSRGIEVRGPLGSLRWSAGEHRVERVGVDGSVESWTFDSDADRNSTMAVQMRAALTHSPGNDAVRRAAGAPATLAEGLDTLRLCDDARAFSLTRAQTTARGDR